MKGLDYHDSKGLDDNLEPIHASCTLVFGLGCLSADTRHHNRYHTAQAGQPLTPEPYAPNTKPYTRWPSICDSLTQSMRVAPWFWVLMIVLNSSMQVHEL
jgi:hypothetical protein